jgi:hypothetical protein
MLGYAVTYACDMGLSDRISRAFGLDAQDDSIKTPTRAGNQIRKNPVSIFRLFSIAIKLLLMKEDSYCIVHLKCYFPPLNYYIENRDLFGKH